MRDDPTVLLRAEEVGRILGVGRSTVCELIVRGQLPVVRIGRLVRMPRPALDRWIDQRTSGGRAA